MIFQRALQRELISTAGAVFTVLFTIAVTIRPIKILGMAANGTVDPNDVFILVGFAALNLLPVILVLTGFISILMVLSRSYRDSEMVVWFASGLSLLSWLKPILQFSIPLVLMTAVMTFFLGPWATKYSDEYMDRYESRSDVARVSPGRFQESAARDRVLFVEGVAGDLSKVRNIFVNTIQNNRFSIIVAKEGVFELSESGDKFLVMHQGHRYDQAADGSDFQLMQFDRYGVLVENQKNLMADKKAGTLSMQELWAVPTPVNLGELLWRISLPIIGLLLMLLAVPLSHMNPRSGRSANFLIALFLSVFYYNMMLASQAWIQQSQLSFSLAWWPIHFAFLLLVIILFGWRLNVNSRYHPLQLWAKLIGRG